MPWTRTSGKGHSTGGLLAQMLAGRGLWAATVAIDPGIFRGVLPLPASVLRVAGPFLVNPAHARPRDHAQPTGVLGTPVIAAAGTALATRSRLPLTRRLAA